MRTFERLSRELLLWIHEQAGNDTKKVVDPKAFLNFTTGDQGKIDSAVEYLARQGLVEARKKRKVLPPVSLTSEGVQQAEREKAQPLRRAQTRQNLLTWTYDQPGGRRLPGIDVMGLAQDPRCMVDGEMMTIDELNAAAQTLRDIGMVNISAQDMNGGFSISLTQIGIDCVELHGGDARAARAAVERPGPSDSGAPAPAREPALNVGGLLRFAAATRQAIPALHLSSNAEQVIETAATSIDAEVATATPNPDRLRAHAANIQAALESTAGNALASALLATWPRA